MEFKTTNAMTYGKTAEIAECLSPEKRAQAPLDPPSPPL
jgi:hypothetical protein